MKSKQFLKEGFVEDAQEAQMDHEVQMARVDCYYAAEHAMVLHKLLRNISEEQGLEGWVASKITLANDYLKSVREHLEYQMMSADADESDFLPIAEGLNPVKKNKINESDDNRDMNDFERGPWYIILKGSPVSDNGSPKKFNWLNGAKTFFRTIMDEDPKMAEKIKQEYEAASDKKSIIYYSKKLPTTSSQEETPTMEASNKPGLWANIRAKRERIKSGSGERMRSPGSKGAPSDKDLKSIRASSVKEGWQDEFADMIGQMKKSGRLGMPKSNYNFKTPEPKSKEELMSRLKELEAEFDPAYQQSDDYSFWKKQNDIASEISSIRRQLRQQGVAEGEVIRPDFSRGKGVENPNINAPKGYDRFESDGKKIIGIKDGKKTIVSTTSDERLARELVMIYNGGKVSTELKPISMLQAFGSKQLATAENMGIKLAEKPDHWADFEEYGFAAENNFNEIKLKKLEKAVGKLKTYKGVDIYGKTTFGDKPRGPQSRTIFMPSENMFIIKFDDGTRYVVDKTGAATYIRNWQKIDDMLDIKEQGVAEGYSLKKTNVEKTFHPGDPEDYGSVDMTRKDTDYEIINNKTGQVVGTASWTTNDYFGPGALKITMKNGATRYLDIWDSEKGNPQSAFNRFVKDPRTSKKYKEQGVAEGKIQYGVLDNDNVNLIIDKSESKPDGIYRFRGILFKVKGGKVTHYAIDGKILQAMGRFNTQIGSYDSSSQAKSILKGIKEGVAEGLSDIVKGIKRKVAGKTDPKEVAHTYARIARRDIEDANKLNNQAAYDARDKSTKRWEKVNKVVNKEGVAEGLAQEWEVSFDYGPHESERLTVKADSKEEAIAKVKEQAKKSPMFKNISINWAKPVKQGVAEGGILKSIKRSLQGWGGVQSKPSDIKRRAGEWTDDEIKGIAGDYDQLRRVRATAPMPTEVPKHSPAGLQKRVVDREMKKRGLGEKGVAEGIKGWKHAHSDMMKNRAESGKDVHLVSLKKDGTESKMHDAKKSFKSEEEARAHHKRVKELNPNRTIAHNLYVGGKVEKLS
jgi:hypothetical protein